MERKTIISTFRTSYGRCNVLRLAALSLVSVSCHFAASAENIAVDEEKTYGELHGLIVERMELWPGCAPHETTRDGVKFAFDEKKGVWRTQPLSSPEVILLKRRDVASDTLALAVPGGGYNTQNMGTFCRNIRPIVDTGRWVAVLHHRIPRRRGRKPYEAAREDGTRAVRLLRANAERFGCSRDKIGAMGFSAGGHLAALLAASSQDEPYAPVDDVDRTPANVNFAVAVYPAYVTDDGSSIKPEFKFDAMTPPMFLLHGDDDPHSPLASVLIYSELHRRKIPAQMFIFAHAAHGLNDKAHVRGWQWRIVDWLDEMKF